MASESTGISQSVITSLLGREMDLFEENGLTALIALINGRKLEYFHTVGVYANDECKSNHVGAEDLANHICYNLVMRPGRAFFVNGVPLNKGYLDSGKLDYWTRKLAKAGLPVMRKSSAPYQ